MKKIYLTFACLVPFALILLSGCSATPYYIFERRVTSRQATFKLKVPDDTTNAQMTEWAASLTSTYKSSPNVFITFYKGGETLGNLEAQYSSDGGFTDLKP